MKLRFGRFNYYLGCVVLCLIAGCASGLVGRQKEESFLQFFTEAQSEAGDRTAVITVCRSSPVPVRVNKQAFLDSRDLADAAVLDQVGGFAVALRFTARGTLVLEQITTAHRGARIVIYGMFPGGRWLAAPMIPRRITDGVLVFTPDATHEEAERLVRGLNNMAIHYGNKPKPPSPKKPAK